MAIDIKTIQHNDYLEFVVTGSHDLSEAVDKFTHLLETAKRTGLKKILIDYRELIYDTGATHKALYAFGIEDLYKKYLQSGGHDLKIAYLAPVIHTFEPGAEIGRNAKSLQFELFDKRNEALEWLDIKNY